ncbi:MAG: dockerin type I repeat-containing protein [Phycisphaerales bacterium]|nr:dockerin type I repeat-containing protein [Phycisphaerales bacterium]
MRRTMTVSAGAVVAFAGLANAQYQTNLGDLFVTTTENQVDMNGANIPAGTYTSFTVTVDWVAGSGNPWSTETRLSFTDSFDLTTAVFHLAPIAPTDGAMSSGDPAFLTWNGFMAPAFRTVEVGFTDGTPYEGGDPLIFNARQTFGTSDASWNNVSVTLGFDSPPPPPGIFSESWHQGHTGTGNFWVRTNAMAGTLQTNGPVEYETVEFTVSESGSYDLAQLSPDHDGYLHIYEGSFDPNDQFTNLIAANDDGPLLGIRSSVVTDVFMSTGTTYIAVVSAWSAGSGSGPFTLNALGPGEPSLVGGPTCPPDLNGDGVVDADDFFLFLQLFAAGDLRADFNNDGVIDADDFFEFLNAFAAGC